MTDRFMDKEAIENQLDEIDKMIEEIEASAGDPLYKEWKLGMLNRMRTFLEGRLFQAKGE